MKTLHETATAILEEFKRIQTIPPNQINEGHPFPIPGIIGVSADGGIYVSHLIDEQISIFARRLLRDSPEIRSTNTQSEWIARVRRAFGPALADIDLDLSFEESAITLVASVCSTVSNTPQLTTPEEHAFGCTLFSHSDCPPIRIGPTTIENREDWLTRVEIYRAISKTTCTRLRSAWRGEKLRKRKPSIDSIHENDILRAIGSCPYVCSVVTDGLSADAAGKRARISARLALTAIALIWQSPTRALNGFNLLIDASAKSQQRVTFLPGRRALITGASRSHMPSGPWIKPSVWVEEYTAKEHFFVTIGEALEFYRSSTGNVRRPRLMSTLSQALLWFHEGCREIDGAMAVVKFAACMDALSCGRKARGIRSLISCQLKIDDNFEITPDGLTLKQALEQIYGEGRSRTLHGTNEKFAHDWTGIRDIAEQLARLCLVNCIDSAATNWDIDDPSMLSRRNGGETN